LDVTSVLPGERGEVGRPDRGGCSGRRIATGVKKEVMSFTFFVK